MNRRNLLRKIESGFFERNSSSKIFIENKARIVTLKQEEKDLLNKRVGYNLEIERICNSIEIYRNRFLGGKLNKNTFANIEEDFMDDLNKIRSELINLEKQELNIEGHIAMLCEENKKLEKSARNLYLVI